MPQNYNSEVREDNLALKEAEVAKIEEVLRGIAKSRGVDLSHVADKDGHPHIQEELEPGELIVRILSELTPHEFEWNGGGDFAIIASRWQRKEGEHELEQEVWRQLAPYIQAGSYIEVSDDKGLFRWAFTDGSLFMIKPGWPRPMPQDEVKPSA